MAALRPEDRTATDLAGAGELEALLERIFGSRLSRRGLLAAVQVWQGERGLYRILDDPAGAPACLHARLASQAARARADAILTTSAVLRRHPGLDHRLSGPSADALAEWRHHELHKPEPPVTLVLAPDDAVEGDSVELEHPVFQHWTRPVILTSRQAQWQLESRAVDLGIEVVGADEPSPSAAVDFLRHAFGAATIALELGGDPTLFRPPVAVDEVLLSVCQTPQHSGQPFLNALDLAQGFPHHSTPYPLQAGADVWRLQRFSR
ncbi:MAG: hypothetical protein AAF560_26255 [Acidobacteriota bacterium]